jgi:hypothetical protein
LPEARKEAKPAPQDSKRVMIAAECSRLSLSFSRRKSDRSGIVSAFPGSIAHLERWFSERYIVIAGSNYFVWAASVFLTRSRGCALKLDVIVFRLAIIFIFIESR